VKVKRKSLTSAILPDPWKEKLRCELGMWTSFFHQTLQRELFQKSIFYIENKKR